jgi:hypothetical protein
VDFAPFTQAMPAVNSGVSTPYYLLAIQRVSARRLPVVEAGILYRQLLDDSHRRRSRLINKSVISADRGSVIPIPKK